MNNPYRDAYLEVDLGRIVGNLKAIKSLFPQGVYCLATIKADAYGHGIVQVAKTLQANGINYLGVANLDEAIVLRKNGIRVPILVLSEVPVRHIDVALFYNVAVTIASREYLDDLCLGLPEREEAGVASRLTVHIKVDTGMHRQGISTTDALFAIKALDEKGVFNIEGIYTHLAAAADDKDFTLEQIGIFRGLINYLKQQGVYFPLVHLSNSAGLAFYKEISQFCNMIRPGIGLYGGWVSDAVHRLVRLQPALSLKAKVAQTRVIKSGESVGYSRNYFAQRDTLIGILPVGYGDGLPRLLSNRGRVIINEKFYPIVGNVCMDMCFVASHDFDAFARGDEAVFLGRQGVLQITANDVAEMCSTIDYEILCHLGRRLRRVYVYNGGPLEDVEARLKSDRAEREVRTFDGIVRRRLYVGKDSNIV